MTKKVYSIRKKKDTEEYHIFECEPATEKTCRCNSKSICNKMDKSEAEKTIYSCLSENETRLRAAEIGRPVCGTCVSHVYESY